MSSLCPSSGVPSPALPAGALERLEALLSCPADTGRRRVLGLVGAPGAGKSTLAEALDRKSVV